MTIQTLIDCWVKSGQFHDVNPPATESEIQAAEEKIGAQLPRPLREIYSLFNGRWAWELDFYPLNFPPEHSSVVLANANEKYIEYGWHIPKEIRLFAGDGGGGAFGIWLPTCGNPIYNHPIIEVGELAGEEGCMGVAGTNLISFLHGWAAYHLGYDERNKLGEGELELKAIQSTLDTLQIPQSMRGEQFDDQMPPFRHLTDPQLPDPYGTSYSQRYTITDLKRIFGET